ncbi:MAG: hypothetical protein JWR54_2928 [Mucilaginibacter sp.]|jgi:hypothetical protein|nr:hypothetical protein [Mucilaginibacter sp.]
MFYLKKIHMKKLSLLLLLLVIFASCKKEKPPVTVPVKFTSTTYQTLGAADNTGKPLNMDTPDVVSDSLKNYLHTTLPEHVNLATSRPDLLSSTAIGDIAITQKSEIEITYVSYGTGYSDAVAFYTYPTNSPPASAADIKVITYIFPNAGAGTTLKPGDKVNIGTFDAGTSVGFVLLQDAFNMSSGTLNNSAVHFCSNDVLNPEVDPGKKKHAVLLNYPAENKTLIGFEDIDRTSPSCDNDFNDIVIYASWKAK